jgi:hypothetical protein
VVFLHNEPFCIEIPIPVKVVLTVEFLGFHSRHYEEFCVLGYNAACFIMLVSCFFSLSLSSTVKMEEMYSAETSVDFQRTTRRYITEDRTLHS